MKYNLANPSEAHAAMQQLVGLVGEKKVVEIKKLSPRRSLAQNRYLHLLIGAFGAHFGYTAEEAKLIYKDINKSLYKYEKKGRTFYKSSRDLTKEDMTKSIDVFRQASAEAGYPLPLATDIGWLRSIENEIELARFYL